jgi:LacI family transcriptional regulator
MRVTIRDVAAKAGVSINTVSRVLNDRPDVNEATRSRVRAAITELGYRPNSLARSLIRRTSRTIGLVVTDCTNPNSARQIRVVQQAMSRAGYAVLIFDTQEDGEQERAALELLEENMVDGIIITPVGSNDGGDLASLSQRVPVVLLNREVDGRDTFDVVLNDNAAGAQAAVEHLISLGHSRIGYVTASTGASTVNGRLLGYRRALEAAGIKFDESLIVRTQIDTESAAEATANLLQTDRPPTAILAYNDLMALGVFAALSRARLRVPDDIALVGYDDIVYAPYLQVPLTTVRQQTQEMGEAASSLLLERLNGAEGVPKRVVLQPELIVRRSSGGAG